jgi:dTDP-glucose 4,6-dehydratase
MQGTDSVKHEHRPRRVLVTGGAGFIGCNHIRHVLGADPDLHVVNVDALTYAGHLANVRDVEETFPDRYTFEHSDIRDRQAMRRVFAEHEVDTVVHFAAESHVDRSIDGPMDFVETNVMGTAVLLETARACWQDRDDVRFHHVSTDEVYGSLGDEGLFTEDTPYDPSSPYSASKAASDHLVRAWSRTYRIPVTISNCSNNFGPYQFPEKLIPLMIRNAVRGIELPVYGDGRNVRDWLYVEDHCRAVDVVVRRGLPGRTYNVGAHNEQMNIDVVHLMCDVLDELKPRQDGSSYRQLVTFVPDRPGHDRRYAIDGTRLQGELGWGPEHSFEEALRRTVAWYLDNEAWCEEVTSGRYDGGRLGLGE